MSAYDRKVLNVYCRGHLGVVIPWFSGFHNNALKVYNTGDITLDPSVDMVPADTHFRIDD